MIYSANNLQVKILFENTRKVPIKGIYRPQAYLDGVVNYCTTCKFDLLTTEIVQGERKVFTTILESPKGFGHHLKEGALLTIREGLDVVGKAIILDIIGY